MSAPKTIYHVEVLDVIDGKKTWRTLLNTSDETEAKALVAAMEQDGVRAQIEIIPPKQR
jgi:hypothetical protein